MAADGAPSRPWVDEGGSQCARSDSYLAAKSSIPLCVAKGPKGDQLDVVESFDIDNGLIVYHRVYWGWRGFQLLDAAKEQTANERTVNRGRR